MYMPPHFEETRIDVLLALIEEFPLGALITHGAEGLTANHVPFLGEPAKGEQGARLIGHVARNNHLWHDTDSAIEPMVIFGGDSAYISPNWYETKRDTHKVVPTYNYAVVHVHGPLIVHDDPKWVRGLVGKLTKAMEASQTIPWKMGDAPQEFLADQLDQIVGIEIPINQIVGKWKVSQNRVVADREGAIAGLRANGDHQSVRMAKLIESHLNLDQ
jgi:transcriptional regulator